MVLDILKAIETITKILDWIIARKDKYPSNKEIAITLSQSIGELVDRFEKVAEEILLLFHEESVQRGKKSYFTFPYRIKIDSLNRNLLKTFREMQLIYWDLDAVVRDNVDSAPLRSVLEACGQMLEGEGYMLFVTEAQKRAIESGRHEVFYTAERYNAVTPQYFDRILRELIELRYKVKQLERLM